MNGLVQFMNGGLGRILRVVLGLVLVYVGLFTMGGGIGGYIVAVIGVVPIVMGALGRCLIEFVMPKSNRS